MDIQPLRKKSSRDHSHLCPRQILGVRLGLAGMKALGFDAPPDKKTPADRQRDRWLFRRWSLRRHGLHRGPLDFTGGRLRQNGGCVCGYGHGPDKARCLGAGIRQKALAYASDEPRHYFAQLQAYQVMPDEEMFTLPLVRLSPSPNARR